MNQNTCSGTRNNTMFLLNCTSLKQYFDLRFSYLEKLEKLLEKYYKVKIPISLRSSHYNLNDSFQGRDVYRIELFDLQDESEIAVLIPFLNEGFKNYLEHGMFEFPEDKGVYSIFVYPPMKTINEINCKRFGYNFENTYTSDWSYNVRNIYIRRFGTGTIPYFSLDYEDAPIWNKHTHHAFSNEDKRIVLSILSIQKSYPWIDKNIFLEIISKNFNENSKDLAQMLETIKMLKDALAKIYI